MHLLRTMSCAYTLSTMYRPIISPFNSTAYTIAVAVVRLSKSFTREVPPFSDFPSQLTNIMRGYCTQVDGGLPIDGSMEAPIIKSQIVEECAQIRKRGIKAVVVSGVFSPS